ncbi:hypothetical protein GCM10028773_25680 [Spirosoma koreense]
MGSTTIALAAPCTIGGIATSRLIKREPTDGHTIATTVTHKKRPGTAPMALKPIWDTSICTTNPPNESAETVALGP